MASCRDCPCDSASCRESRQEAKSHGQSLQEAIYPAQQSRQEAKSHGQSLQEAIYPAQQSRQVVRDHGQSRWKPNMTDSLCRKRKLTDSFILKKKRRQRANSTTLPSVEMHYGAIVT